MGPFDRFNDRAKRVLALAQDEAVRFNHDYIGPEHLLLGLIREGAGVAAKVLGSFGVDLLKLRKQTEDALGRGKWTQPPREITLHPQTKKIVELAIDEARKLGHSHVGTEHLLLGIVRLGNESTAARTLATFGVELEKVRHQVISTLGQPHTSTAATSAEGPFARFNDRAKKTLALAQGEAIRLKHNYIGTEHLLLGLVSDTESIAGRVLHSLGVDLAKVRTAVEFIIGMGDAAVSPSEITLSPRTRKVIELAIDEAGQLGQGTVGPEHILLGLAREGEGIASGVLESLGLTMDKVRQQVLGVLGRTGDAVGRTVTASDRLDDAARRVLALAKNEALGLQQSWIGTAHVLLGLVSANGTVAQRALHDLGVTLEAARDRVAKTEAPGTEWQTSGVALTPRAERLVETAVDLAAHRRATPEHFLFALMADRESAGSQVLTAMGISPEKVRESLDRLTGPSQ